MRRFALSVTAALVGLALTSPDAFGRGSRRGSHHHGHHHHGHHHHGHHHHGVVRYHAPVVAAPAAPAPADEQSTANWQTCCYLRIKNDTDAKITVFLQYRTWTDKQRYVWYPADPATEGKPLEFEIEPGEEADLYHGEWRINASRVRLWASSANGEWPEYKDKDLFLVAQQDDGQRYYYADEMETYTFTFAP